MRRISLTTAVACSIAIVAVVVIVIGRFMSNGIPRNPISTDTRPAVTDDGSKPIPLAYQPPSDEGYVGSEACSECHRAIADSYKGHPMARSITTIDPASPEALVTGVKSRVDGTTRCFDVEMNDGAMIHHERMYDSTGEQIYDQAVRMDYVVGSGKRAKAYLYQEGRLMFMSPLNWYSQSGEWDLAPGYVRDDPRRFDRRVTDECLSCHAGRIASAGRALNAYQKPAFHELAIGCENCHGAGQKHVSLRSSGAAIEDGADPIINPVRLDVDRRESVCNQCHLQAAVRLPRLGRSDLDFRPGQNIDEIWSVLDIKRPITADGKTHAVNHVQQMRESVCYSKSGGRLGCTSCHDPHGIPKADEKDAFYRHKCLACHEPSACSETPDRRQVSGDACARCHMPERKSSNVSHVTQTDHHVIRTWKPSAEESTPDSDTLTFFDDQNLRLTPLERERGLGLGAWMRLMKTGRRSTSELGQFLNHVLEKSPHDGQLLTALGSMAQENNRIKLAQSYYERALQIPAAEEAAVTGLLEISYAVSDWDAALKFSDRLIEINPRSAKTFSMRADILTSLGRADEGIEAARQALTLNPSLISVRRWLANAYRNANRESEAKQEESLIQRMETARIPSTP